jgi:excisionase family DNA binding protein
MNTRWVNQDIPDGNQQPASLLTEKEVRDYLNVSRSTMHNIVRNKDLTAIKVSGVWRFRQSDVDRYLQERENTREG